MRKESKNWKLVKDRELFEFSDDDSLTALPNNEELKCENCGLPIKKEEKWEAFQRNCKVRRSSLGEGYVIRAVVEFYCQNCVKINS